MAQAVGLRLGIRCVELVSFNAVASRRVSGFHSIVKAGLVTCLPPCSLPSPPPHADIPQSGPDFPNIYKNSLK